MTRTTIPKEVAARILFDSDRTCCVCRVRGKPVQVHHIDENPSNNDPSNLAVLCFDCHRDTQITGGFDRKLDAHQVILYRDDWVDRVRNRRSLSDGLEEALSPAAVIVQSVEAGVAEDVEHTFRSSRPQPDSVDLRFIISLPERRLRAYRMAQSKWDTGVTATMVEGNGDVIEELLQMLVELASYYPPGHFDGRRPDDYFKDRVRSLAEWHRNCLEPHGPGTGGTIVNVMTGGQVISDLEKMVEDMVMSLTSFRDDFNFQEWRRAWKDGGV